MMVTLVATAAGATFLTGLAGSPHCALMCGPLACAGLAGDPASRRRVGIAWQLGRLSTYAIAGALLGTLGRGALALLQAPAARALPWIMAFGLVLSALEVGRRLPALPGLSRIPAAAARLGGGLPPMARALLRGAATPFLPCGLLYGAFVVAIGAGSMAAGAAVMLAFALGGVPALAIVQASARRLAARPRLQRVARRLLPLVAAGVVIWRASSASPGAPPPCHRASEPAAATSAVVQTLDEKRLGPAADLGAR